MSGTTGEKIYGTDSTDRRTRLLRIKVIRAIELQTRDFLSGSGDPYIKISLKTADSRNTTVDSTRTRVVPKTLNPLWNQDFLFRVRRRRRRKKNESIINVNF